MGLRHKLGTLAVVGMAGCGPAEPTKPYDPHIKAERRIEYPGGGVYTPIGGAGYQHGAKTERYEGPVSQAPPWAKSSPEPQGK
jgi:hypothetical protein